MKSLGTGRNGVQLARVGVPPAAFGSLCSLVKFGFVCVVDTLKGLRRSYQSACTSPTFWVIIWEPCDSLISKFQESFYLLFVPTVAVNTTRRRLAEQQLSFPV